MTLQAEPIRDANLQQTIALPNGAASVNSASIDLQNGPNGVFPGKMQIEVVAPALATADLPDTKTMVYKLEDSADDSSFATVPGCDAIITQTGAGGAGAAAATELVRVPKDVRRYLRLTATNDGTGDASDKSATLSVVI